MGIDPGQLAFGIQAATDPNPTLDSLTVTGTTTLSGSVVTDLPIADPEVVGELWADTNVVTVSEGAPP
jgi:hypothetical protein